MKKTISILLLVSLFYACTKSKELPAKQENLQSVDVKNAATSATINQTADTTKNQNPLFIKKKVVKIKYPKPRK